MKRYIKAITLLLVIFTCVSFVACGSKSVYDSDRAPGASVGNGAESEKGNLTSSIVDGDINRKIVYSVDMDMEVENVSAVKEAIAKKNKELGGYVESNRENYSEGECTYVNITFRIPTEKLDELIASIEGQGGIESKSVSTTDITTEYVSAEAEKLALEERKQQLQQILDETEMTAGERIQMVNEISAVNTQLQSIELIISQYDAKVDYSTVYVRISQQASLWETVAPAIIFFVFIVTVAAAVVLTVVISCRIKKKKANAGQ